MTWLGVCVYLWLLLCQLGNYTGAIFCANHVLIIVGLLCSLPQLGVCHPIMDSTWFPIRLVLFFMIVSLMLWLGQQVVKLRRREYSIADRAKWWGAQASAEIWKASPPARSPLSGSTCLLSCDSFEGRCHPSKRNLLLWFIHLQFYMLVASRP